MKLVFYSSQRKGGAIDCAYITKAQTQVSTAHTSQRHRPKYQLKHEISFKNIVCYEISFLKHEISF